MIDAEILAAFFEDATDVLQQWERFCLALNPESGPIIFEPILRCAHNLKGSAGMVGFMSLHNKLHHIEDHLVIMQASQMTATDEVVGALLDVEHTIRHWVDAIRRNPDLKQEFTSTELDARLKQLTATASVEAQEQRRNTDGDRRTAARNDARPEIRPEIRSEIRPDETLRVAASKLDRLIQLVGEISLHQSILVRAATDNALNTTAIRAVIDLKSKLTQDLQDAALSLRMIPVEGLFQKIERMVRDTAKRENKQVQVRRLGEDVALDKLIVEGMVEPLIHIARNAVDHGIESPAERVASGKPPHGTVQLIAENTSIGVTLIFKDDGRGIDPDRVFRKAVEKGLLDANAEISEAAKLQLIFLPGFSTAEKITELSGRGVGMDVVSATVKRMAGQLEVQSEVGRGTTIEIMLPTNLSIIDALIVKVNGALYALPNRDIQEVIDLRDYSVASIDGDHEQAIDLRGRIVPVAIMNLFLSQKGEITCAAKNTERSLVPKPAIAVPLAEDMLMLAVEAVIGQQKIFVRPLMGHLTTVSYYSGSTILSDGEPCMILNVSEMARRYFTSQ
jgi:two-component system chemotaxis sensor kinase CheA